jgi:hypothetical protein
MTVKKKKQRNYITKMHLFSVNAQLIIVNTKLHLYLIAWKHVFVFTITMILKENDMSVYVNRLLYTARSLATFTCG